MKWTVGNKIAAASVAVAALGLVFAIAKSRLQDPTSLEPQISIVGEQNTTLSNIDGGEGGVSISIENGEPESRELEILKNAGKRVPYDIMEFVTIGTPLTSVNEILGNPFRAFPDVQPLFSEKTIDAQQSLFNFSNVRIGVESLNGETVDAVTFQRTFTDNSPINIAPFQHSGIGRIELGNTTFGPVLRNCDPTKAEFFRSSKDAYFAMECFFGNPGNYRYYTFGCYCHTVHADEFRNGKLISSKGDILNLSNEEIDFVTIAAEPDRGHPLSYQAFR